MRRCGPRATQHFPNQVSLFMKSLLQSSMAAFVIAAQVGCTSLAPVAPGCQGSACLTGLVAGDDVVIGTTSQGTVTLTVLQADDQQITGQTQGQPPQDIVVPANDITSVQKREISTARTTAAVVGTGVVIAVALGVIASVGLAHALIGL